MNIIFINCCMRGEQSRTLHICRTLLARLQAEAPEAVLLEEDLTDGHLLPMTATDIARRDALLAAGALDDAEFAAAHRLKNADCIVIGAPYWDLSFPSALKAYLEHITVNGLLFRYNEQGCPVGLCRARQLYYVTTAGGPVGNPAYGYGYVHDLFTSMFGVAQTRYICAEGLDIWGNDAKRIVADTIAAI